MEYISESTTMSKAMEDYGDRKSCAITTAKRLALFLGEEPARMQDVYPCVVGWQLSTLEPPANRSWLDPGLASPCCHLKHANNSAVLCASSHSS
jgi:hypothetical protein